MSASRSDTGKLVQLVEDKHLHHTPYGVPFAIVPCGDARRAIPIESEEFNQWLTRTVWNQTNEASKSAAVSEAQHILAAKARFDGTEQPLCVRVGSYGEAIYLDLMDDSGTVVKVTAERWSLITDSPVHFRKPQGQLALPVPEHNGDVEALRPFLNADSDDDFRLIVGWCLMALNAFGGPYPVLVLQGVQGSAKSTTARILRLLLDPHQAPLRGRPQDSRDLMISAHNSWVLAYDNLSGLSAGESDTIARLATGVGSTSRKLYTDTDEVVIQACRPTILNGIPAIATRPDLVSRSIVVHLPEIRDRQRRDEFSLYAAFQEARPAIIGGLLDAVSASLRCVSDVSFEQAPRMADFARWVVAAEPTLGWPKGSFLGAYRTSQEDAIASTLETDPVAQAVISLAGDMGTWQGTPTDLFRILNGRVDPNLRRTRSWPDNVMTLSNRLLRIEPALRSLDVIVERDRAGHSGTRRITIRAAGFDEEESASFFEDHAGVVETHPPSTREVHLLETPI